MKYLYFDNLYDDAKEIIKVDNIVNAYTNYDDDCITIHLDTGLETNLVFDTETEIDLAFNKILTALS